MILSGPLVNGQALQGKLRYAGFFTGPIDGRFREITIVAINAYFNRSR